MHEAGPGEKRIARASRTECETLYTMLERGIIKTIRNCVSGQHKMRNTISIPTESDEAAFAYLPTKAACRRVAVTPPPPASRRSGGNGATACMPGPLACGREKERQPRKTKRAECSAGKQRMKSVVEQRVRVGAGGGE